MIKKFIQIKVDVPIYNTDILCLFSDDFPQVLRAVKYHQGWEPKFDSPVGDACCFTKEGKAPIMWMPRFPKSPRDYSHLAHECVHLATFILNECSIVISRENDEVMAYLIGYIVKTILTKP